MTQPVKLTLRLPPNLHAQLKQRSRDLNNSLNTIIIETLRSGLTQEQKSSETKEERAWRVIRESGLWEPLGPIWDEEIAKAPDITYEELWEELKDVPPLSEIIIEEREPR